MNLKRLTVFINQRYHQLQSIILFRKCVVASCMIVLMSTGCSFYEQSFPWRAEDYVPVTFDEPTTTARQWLNTAHEQLKHLLPPHDSNALLTDDMNTSRNEPVDVRNHFGLYGRNLRRLLHNWSGFKHSAQGVGSDQPINPENNPWSQYESVRVPVAKNVALAGMLGTVRDEHGTPLERDCIVLLPGLFGNNTIYRTQDLAQALRSSGFHVLALELRGHGQTELHHPDIPYTFGVKEVVDLMYVSQWLASKAHVHRTGLIGFCWGGNLGLLTAWYDGKTADHMSITEELAHRLPTISTKRHYSAGVMAFSTMLRFEDLVEEMETDKSRWGDPIVATVQSTVRTRMETKSYPIPNHSIRRLIEHENARSTFNYPGSVDDWYRFLRIIPFKDKPDGDKLDSAKIPVLIVHGCNDPLSPAQDVADLMSRVTNPNVAAMILPGGAHVGFAPYADAYYFNLILNFFDPKVGAGVITLPHHE